MAGIPRLVGRWRVSVREWIWIDNFDADDRVRWTDNSNGLTGKGTWKPDSNNTNLFRTSWTPSKTTEEWILSLLPPRYAERYYQAADQ